MDKINLKRIINRKEVSSIIEGFAALSTNPIALLDASAKPIWGGVDKKLAGRYPVELNGEVLGWVAGDEKVSLLASLISFAVAKESEEKALSRETLNRYRELINMYDFSEKISSSLVSEEIARAAIDQAVKSIQAMGASIILTTDPPDTLHSAAANGEACRCEHLLDRMRGLAEAVLKQGRGEIINDVSSDPRLGEVHCKAESIICAPLICKGKALGIFTVCAEKPHVYRAEDLKRLKSIASQTAIALDNALNYRKLQAYSEALEKKNVQLEEEISQRRLSEEALRESEMKYRLHFENVSDVIYSVDAGMHITSISPSVEHIIGYSQAELMSKPFPELNILTEESLSRAVSDTLRIFDGDIVPEAEYELIAKDGSRKIAEIKNRAVYRNGKVAAIVSVARDITDRRHAEQKLEASELEFRTMAESLTNGVIIMKEGKIVYVNDRACEIVGYPREELMNIWGPTLTAPEEYDRREKLIEEVRALGQYPEHLEVWVQRKDGSRCCVNLRFSFSYKENREYAGYVVITDITEQRLAQDQLQAAKSFIDNVVESSLDAIFVTDMEGLVTRVNRYFLELLGYTREEVAGMHISSFSVSEGGTYEMAAGVAVTLDDAYLARQQQVLAKLHESKMLFNWEVYLRERSGKLIPAELNMSYLYNEKGEPSATVGAFRNVTERVKAQEDLRGTLDFLDNVIESSLDAIVISDARGCVYRVNKSFCELTGYTRDDVYGKRMPELSVIMEGTYETDTGETIQIDSRYIDYTMDMHARFVRDGRISGWDSYVIRKDNKVAPVDVNIVYLYDKRGSRAGTVGVLRDTSERKRHEKEILETRDFLDNIIESSRDPIIIADCWGVITRGNRAFQQLIGYKECDIIGKHIGEFSPPQPGLYESTSGGMVEIGESFYSASRDTMVRLVEEGSVSRWESCYFSSDGRIIPVEQTIFYLHDKKGVRVGVVGISRDITERRIAEREIVASRQYLENIFATSADGILVTDSTGTITMVNRAAQEIMGYSSDELIGKPSQDFIPKGGDIEALGKGIQKELNAKGAVYNYEHRWMRKNGMVIEVELSIAFLRDDVNRMTGAVVCMRDITERKAAERRIKEYQYQLRSMASQLTLTEERERRRIATDLHDRIAQSLALSKIKLGSLKAAVPSPDVVKDLDDVRSLLDQSIQDTRSLICDLSPPFLYELGLEKALEWLFEDVEKKYNLKTHFEWDNAILELCDDHDVRILFYQTIRELLVNIIKHAHATTVKVALAKNGQHISISVEDNGKGFMLGPRGLQMGREGGFGLFRIRERFQHLGGSMRVESKLRHGTKISLQIPLKPDTLLKEDRR